MNLTWRIRAGRRCPSRDPSTSTSCSGRPRARVREEHLDPVREAGDQVHASQRQHQRIGGARMRKQPRASSQAATFRGRGRASPATTVRVSDAHHDPPGHSSICRRRLYRVPAARRSAGSSSTREGDGDESPPEVWASPRVRAHVVNVLPNQRLPRSARLRRVPPGCARPPPARGRREGEDRGRGYIALAAGPRHLVEVAGEAAVTSVAAWA